MVDLCDNGAASVARRRYWSRERDPSTLAPLSEFGGWREFLGESIYADLDAEVDAQDNSVVDTVASRRYLHVSDGRLVGWLDAGGAWQIVHADHLGSTRVVTGASGTVGSRIGYSAFGEIMSNSNPGGAAARSRYGYCGGWGYENEALADASDPFGAAGLLHVGARYYSPSLGRFVQRDPIALGGGLNTYEYGFSSPAHFVDAGGLDAGTAAGTVGAAAAAATLSAIGAAGITITVGPIIDNMMAAEHTKNARPSTKDKHQKNRARERQKNRDKKRNKDNWKSHKCIFDPFTFEDYDLDDDCVWHIHTIGNAICQQLLQSANKDKSVLLRTRWLHEALPFAPGHCPNRRYLHLAKRLWASPGFPPIAQSFSAWHEQDHFQIVAWTSV